MSEEIKEKLEEHSKRFDEIDKRFDEHDKRFDEHDKRFDAIDKQIDFIVEKVLVHEERLDRIETNMATKDDVGKILNTLDELVGLYKKTDQEQVFMGERIGRVEKDVEKIKPLVGLVSTS